MNTSPAPSPFSLPDTAPELARRLGLILAGLGGLVARRFVHMPHLVGMTVLLWGRLNRVVRRFALVLARPPVLRTPAVRGQRATVARARPNALPSRRGWVLRELGWEAAAFRGQLEALLADPAMRAALQANPQARRVIGPICRMLGLPAPAPPPAPATARQADLAPEATGLKAVPVTLARPRVPTAIAAPRPEASEGDSGISPERAVFAKDG